MSAWQGFDLDAVKAAGDRAEIMVATRQRMERRHARGAARHAYRPPVVLQLRSRELVAA